jgi:hypothetical protein
MNSWLGSGGRSIPDEIYRRAKKGEKICGTKTPVQGCGLVCTRPLIDGKHIGDAWHQGWHMAHNKAGDKELAEWKDGDSEAELNPASVALWINAPYNGGGPESLSVLGSDEITEWDLLPDAKRSDYESLKTREQLNGSTP